MMAILVTAVYVPVRVLNESLVYLDLYLFDRFADCTVSNTQEHVKTNSYAPLDLSK